MHLWIPIIGTLMSITASSLITGSRSMRYLPCSNHADMIKEQNIIGILIEIYNHVISLINKSFYNDK